ncbi:hypothetical protein N9P07_02400 [Alphaproteobacteria bacterium]|nr:hypothetical protein [Alphaproteobacteria bacterium]
MGSVIYLNERRAQLLNDFNETDIVHYSDEQKRLESIRDGVESVLSLVSGIRKDPEAVALSSARFGVMRMCQFYGRAETMAFVGRCIDTVEMAEDVLKDTP